LKPRLSKLKRAFLQKGGRVNKQSILDQFKVDNEQLFQLSNLTITDFTNQILDSINRGDNLLIIKQGSVPEPIRLKLIELYGRLV